jgi:hypothetical protein
MGVYVKTDWIDETVQPEGTPDIDATNLDKIEQGIFDAHAELNDFTPEYYLAQILSLDGPGSGLNADLLDGDHAAAFLKWTDRGASEGVASLVGGKIPTAQIPALAINDTTAVASEAAMLALTAQRGDMAIRTDFDPDRTYILAGDDPTVLANWIRVTFGDVVSVAGRTGVVTIAAADIADREARIIAEKPNTDAQSTYPLGFSVFYRLAANGTWPTTGDGFVETRRTADGQAIQIYRPINGSSLHWIRYWNAGAWTSFIQVGTGVYAPVTHTQHGMQTWSLKDLSGAPKDVPLPWQVPYSGGITITFIRISLGTLVTSGTYTFDLFRGNSQSPNSLAVPAAFSTLYTSVAKPSFVTAQKGKNVALPDTVAIPQNDYLQPRLAASGVGAENAVFQVGYTFSA